MTLLKKILTHPKMYYPIIMFCVAVTFGPVILLGANRPVYATWVWEGSHPDMPIMLEFSGNVLSGNHVTLTSHEGIQMMAPFLNPIPTTDWVNPVSFLPRHAPWMTRNVNAEISILPSPEGLGINTNNYRGGMKAGFTPGVTQIVVQGRYELADGVLTITYENGTQQSWEVGNYSNTLHLGAFNFFLAD